MKIKLHEKEDLSVRKAEEAMADLTTMIGYMKDCQDYLRKVALKKDIGDAQEFSEDLMDLSKILNGFKNGTISSVVDNMQDLARFAADGSI